MCFALLAAWVPQGVSGREDEHDEASTTLERAERKPRAATAREKS